MKCYKVILALLIVSVVSSCENSVYTPIRVGDWVEHSYMTDSVIEQFVNDGSSGRDGDPWTFRISRDGEVIAVFVGLSAMSDSEYISAFAKFNQSGMDVNLQKGFCRDVCFRGDSLLSVIDNELVYVMMGPNKYDSVVKERICTDCPSDRPERIEYSHRGLHIYDLFDSKFYLCPMDGRSTYLDDVKFNTAGSLPYRIAVLSNGVIVVSHDFGGVDVCFNGSTKHHTQYLSSSGDYKPLGELVSVASSSPAMLFDEALVYVDDSLNLREHKLNAYHPTLGNWGAIDVSEDGTFAFLLTYRLELFDSSGVKTVYEDELKFGVPTMILSTGIRIIEHKDEIVALVPGGVIRGRLSALR